MEGLGLGGGGGRLGALEAQSPGARPQPGGSAATAPGKAAREQADGAFERVVYWERLSIAESQHLAGSEAIRWSDLQLEQHHSLFLGLRPLAGYASLKLYHVMSCFLYEKRMLCCDMAG